MVHGPAGGTAVEEVPVNDRRDAAFDELIAVIEVTDIETIVEDVLDCGILKEGAAPGPEATAVQVREDILIALAGGVAFKDFFHHRRGARIRNQAEVLHGVAVGDGAAGEKALADRLGLSAFDVFGEVRGIILRHRLQQALQDHTLRAVRDILHDGDDADAVLLEGALINGTVVAVAGETVQLPDDDETERMLLRVFDHLLEGGAAVAGTGEGAVDILMEDRIAVFFRESVGVVQLPFDGLLRLGVGGVPRINHGGLQVCGHHSTSFIMENNSSGEMMLIFPPSEIIFRARTSLEEI